MNRARAAAVLLPSLGALAFAIAVVMVAANAPDKGFVGFTGRRVVSVDAGGPADRAGIREGDVIVAVDGTPLRSTVDYIDRVLRRSPGDALALELDRDGRRVHVLLVLETAELPLAAMVAAVLAALLLALGLLARFSQPDDRAAVLFWRTSLVYAVVYAGALSWTHLLVHPALLVIFLSAFCLGAPVVADFALGFPSPAKPVRTTTRALYYVPAVLLLSGILGSLAWAWRDFDAGVPGDRGLTWAVRFAAINLIAIVATTAFGVIAQYRRARRATGAERSQVKWILLGLTLAALPTFAGIPAAAGDVDQYLVIGFRPYVAAVAILWFVGVALAVLRVRLADVDIIIHQSTVYAAASVAAVVLYGGVVLGVGLIAERTLTGAVWLPHLVAAAAAVTTFGPLRGRLGPWLDRRFFRDRMHYVAAVRELARTTARVREPAELARDVVDGTVEAVRATSGALFLAGDDGALSRAHGRGELATASQPVAPDGGIAVPIDSDGRREGVLVLGPRKGGDLYSSEDRDLLAALAEQLATALANARAYGTIAELGRTLEGQNAEIRELRDRLEDENRYLRARLEAKAAERIVGSSKAMRALVADLERVAASDVTVLLTGESGTGKGVAARQLHGASGRAAAPFIHVDCGAVPAGVFESELFGHERGAFTGAVRRHRGHVELADGGTLFLDEIGELPAELQPKLLRVLQEREFVRVGGSAPVSVDVRVVAATNRDLDEMVRAGTFRQDLYYRLRVVALEVPPLRRRTSDIPALVEHLLPKLARRNRRRRVPALSEPAMARLRNHHWPGNVRELQNVLERALVLAEADVIDVADLALPDERLDSDRLLEELNLPADTPHDEVMAAFERRRLQRALEAAGGNQSTAARLLGMPRTTFINKLRRHR